MRLTSIVASCLLLLLLSGCATPRRTLYGADVIRAASIQEVLGCEFKRTFTATVIPEARLGATDIDHPVNSGVDRDLLVDARNLAHEIKANRILWRSIPFKGSRRFDAFYCRDKTALSSYNDKIKAKCMTPKNLVRLCTAPGSAQVADFEKYCSEQFQLNSYADNLSADENTADKFLTDEKINAILARLFKEADIFKDGDFEKYCAEDNLRERNKAQERKP